MVDFCHYLKVCSNIVLVVFFFFFEFYDHSINITDFLEFFFRNRLLWSAVKYLSYFGFLFFRFSWKWLMYSIWKISDNRILQRICIFPAPHYFASSENAMISSVILDFIGFSSLTFQFSWNAITLDAKFNFIISGNTARIPTLGDNWCNWLMNGHLCGDLTNR